MFCLKRNPTLPDIPISEDEAQCMREAEHHSAQPAMCGPSAANQVLYNQTGNTLSQLDPGQLYDWRRGGRSTKAQSTAGQNSLLKQAIANRMVKPESRSDVRTETNAGEGQGEDSRAHDDEEMNHSILMNPAWHRDSDGRTGYKSREWEQVSNKQTAQVKTVSRGEEGGRGDEKSDEKQPLRFSERSDGQRRTYLASEPSENTEARPRTRGKEDLDQILNETNQTVRTMEEMKSLLDKEGKGTLTKDELKMLKKLEKEYKTEQKKKNKEEEKEAKKQEKLEKKKEAMERKGSVSSGLSDKSIETNPTLSEDKTSRKDQSQTPVESSSKEKKDEDAERQITKNLTSPSSHRKPPTGESRSAASKQVRKDSTTSSTRAAAITREDSSTSVASTNSESTIKQVLSPPSRRKKQDQTHKDAASDEQLGDGRSRTKHSPSASSKDEDRPRRPHKTTIGDRRDSSMSESSRVSAFSHKSVTFCDRIQVNEIERREMESSSEEDVAIMSDDELSRPDSERKRKLVRLLQQQQRDEESDDFEDLERKILEEQRERERNMREHAERTVPMPMYNIAPNNQDTFSYDDVNPDRYILEDGEAGYISIDNLPASVREAILRNSTQTRFYRDRGEADYMGSMSKLHNEGSHSPSLLHGTHLPRSASGYLELGSPPPMLGSYQQAMQQPIYNPEERNPISPTSPTRNGALAMSYYDNVQGRTGVSGIGGSSQNIPKLASPTTSLPPVNMEQKYQAPGTFHFNYPASEAKTRASNRELRDAFFKGTGNRSSSEPQTEPSSDYGTSGTDTSSSKGTLSAMEGDMRKKFVARFGAHRRAPIAEEDPADPRHSLGSSESVFSTDSRESVVSAASMRAEKLLVRRGFQY